MTDPLMAYEWECPICNETKRGLSTETASLLRGQAKNALLRHVKALDSEHGKEGELPSGFTEQDVVDYIKFTENVDTSLDDDTHSV